MMDWMLVLQIVLLLFVANLLGIMAHGAVLDARRQDAIKRRDAGL